MFSFCFLYNSVFNSIHFFINMSTPPHPLSGLRLEVWQNLPPIKYSLTYGTRVYFHSYFSKCLYGMHI